MSADPALRDLEFSAFVTFPLQISKGNIIKVGKSNHLILDWHSNLVNIAEKKVKP